MGDTGRKVEGEPGRGGAVGWGPRGAMPGLKLTRHQAARLCGLDSRVCDAVLAALVRDRFLVCTRSDAFVRQD